MICFHLFVDGFGGMGDALTCCKCGLSRYPDALSPWSLLVASLPGRVVQENHKQYSTFVAAAQAAQRERCLRSPT